MNPPENELAKLFDKTKRREYLPEPVNELKLLYRAKPLDWARAIPVPRRHSLRTQEWYFQCALCGFESLRDVVEIDPDRRGGVPVLKGTRFTVSEALAEISESDAILEIAENFDLDKDVLKDMLNGLSLVLNRPYEP